MKIKKQLNWPTGKSKRSWDFSLNFFSYLWPFNLISSRTPLHESVRMLIGSLAWHLGDSTNNIPSLRSIKVLIKHMSGTCKTKFRRIKLIFINFVGQMIKQFDVHIIQIMKSPPRSCGRIPPPLISLVSKLWKTLWRIDQTLGNYNRVGHI